MKMRAKILSKGDIAFNIVNYAFLTFALLIVLYPLYFIVIASVSDPSAVATGKTWMLPKGISFDGYSRILKYSKIWVGYKNTIFYTVSGTLINLALTLTAAYPLSKKNLDGRKIIMTLIIFTMLFNGGMIPRYLLIKDLGLYDSVWVMLLPHAVSAWNLIIARTFFESSIPNELNEAAFMDGCSNTRFFISIVLPLSSALIAVMTLFYSVYHWNAFFDAMLFLKSEKLYPLQLILREILIMNQTDESMMTDVISMETQIKIAESIKYGVIIVSSIPVLVLYPFLQKYFVKGVMIGAIKG